MLAPPENANTKPFRQQLGVLWAIRMILIVVAVTWQVTRSPVTLLAAANTASQGATGLDCSARGVSGNRILCRQNNPPLGTVRTVRARVCAQLHLNRKLGTAVPEHAAAHPCR